MDGCPNYELRSTFHLVKALRKLLRTKHVPVDLQAFGIQAIYNSRVGTWNGNIFGVLVKIEDRVGAAGYLHRPFLLISHSMGVRTTSRTDP
ncbi:hypothetical protein VTL71DRAFT_16051, partial [Oculimacula yallundae]